MNAQASATSVEHVLALRYAAKDDGATITSSPSPLAKNRLWLRSLLWLLFLGPFFFLSYGFANWWTEHHAAPGSLVLSWEQHIPFAPWTIVPYWSIDLLYGLSFLLCHTRKEVDIHALRLLTVQLISIGCFLLFPLRFSFAMPAYSGTFSGLFELLHGFDQPYNQAPSLHIALLVVLWTRFATVTQGVLKLLTHLWALLIAVSVLTTYQHHFIDVPTGLLAGMFCLWLWPMPFEGSRPGWHPARSRTRIDLGLAYFTAALSCAIAAFFVRGIALWLLWPACALALVSLNYLFFGAQGFQKREGRHSVACACLLAPYLALAWLNSRLWTYLRPAPSLIMDGVWLGRSPDKRQIQAGDFRAICDLAAELPCPRGHWVIHSLPLLDLVVPDLSQLKQAAEQIEKLRDSNPVLVCCALGYSRSAIAVAAWLLQTGRAGTVQEAVCLLTVRRPEIVLRARHLMMLEAFQLALKSSRP